MTVTTTTTDEELARRASEGDKEAFAALYERHFRGVYDLAIRMVREQEAALDAVQNAFLSAWLNLQKRTVTGNVKAWLYTIARNSAINELRRGKRFVTLDEETPETRYRPAFAQLDAERLADPEAIAEDKEVVELVWSSAAALSPREYSLLDLHVRRGLSTEDLSQTLGVPKSNIYTQLSRLRDSLEESVTASLLMRRGRRDCPDLDALVAAAGAGLTRDVRHVVSRHVRDCARCQESRRRFVAPAEVFAALALVPAPAEADKLWLGVAGGAGFLTVVIGSLLTPVRWFGALFRDAGMPIKTAIAASAATSVGVPVIVGTLLITGGDDPVQPAIAVPTRAASASPSPTVLSAVATPAPPTPTPTPAPPASTLPEATTPAAAATPLIGVAAARTPSPEPTPTPTPVPTPVPPAVLPTPFPAQIKVTPLKQIQSHSSATMLVAFFGSAEVHVSDINLDSVRLGGAPLKKAQVRDLDGNGELDLVLQFKVSEIALPTNGEVCIEGETIGGQRFAGCGAIRYAAARRATTLRIPAL